MHAWLCVEIFWSFKKVLRIKTESCTLLCKILSSQRFWINNEILQKLVRSNDEMGLKVRETSTGLQ